MVEYPTLLIVAPYIGFIAVPLFTHIHSLYRERLTRLDKIINELDGVFVEINEIFFNSVTSNKDTDEKLIEDAVREQQIIIQLQKIDQMCKRAAKLTPNLDSVFHQINSSTIRRIATNDQRRTPENLTHSSRQISDAQNNIIQTMMTTKIRIFHKLF